MGDKVNVNAVDLLESAFYPAVEAKRTEDILLESLEEHLGIKRVLSDLIDLDASDETFDAKIFDEETLVVIARQMALLHEELLAKSNPRLAVPARTEEAAPL